MNWGRHGLGGGGENSTCFDARTTPVFRCKFSSPSAMGDLQVRHSLATTKLVASLGISFRAVIYEGSTSLRIIYALLIYAMISGEYLSV